MRGGSFITRVHTLLLQLNLMSIWIGLAIRVLVRSLIMFSYVLETDINIHVQRYLGCQDEGRTETNYPIIMNR
jgi:hypothetical protein